MNIIELDPEDNLRLLQFYTSLSPAVTETYRPFRDVNLEVMKEHLDGAGRGDHISFALESENKILGHSFIMNAHRKHPVFGIGLAEKAHGKGWGRLLMGRVLDEAERQGITYITLTVLKYNNRAISLYTSYGFKVVRDHTFKEKEDSHFMIRSETV